MSVDRPLGFFWDLENIQVPSGKSALAVVSALRAKLGHAGCEVEFVAVCDVTKEKHSIINELNCAQVCVVHVSAESKNAADEKLKSYLRKFAHTYKSPGTVIVVSGDINFAPDLKDLRFRFGFNVILIHGSLVSEALLATAVDHYDFRQIVGELGDSPAKQKTNMQRLCQLQVRNLPSHVDEHKIRERLRQISDNCGGRVVSVNKTTRVALVRFPNPDATVRALKRMGDADVFGVRITVSSVDCKSAHKLPQNKHEVDVDEQVDKHRYKYKKRPVPTKSSHYRRTDATQKETVFAPFEDDEYEEVEEEEEEEEEEKEEEEAANDEDRMPMDPLSMRILEVLIAQPSLSVSLPQLMAAYAAYHGEPLNPARYNCSNVRQLVDRVAKVIQLQKPGNGPPLLTLSEGRQRSIRAQQIFYVFLRRPDMEFSVGHFRREMELAFGCCIDLYTLLAAFPEIMELVKVSPYRTLVRLTPLQRFALRSRLVLLMHGGQDVPVLVFQRSYEARFAEPINPETFGFRALLGLVRAASHVLYIKGRSVTATVTVNRNFLAALKALKSDIIIPGRPGGLGEEPPLPPLSTRPPPPPPPPPATHHGGRRTFVRPPPLPPRLQRDKAVERAKSSPSPVADDRKQQTNVQRLCQLQVRNLPSHVDEHKIRERLRQISDNCGGRVVSVNKSARVALVRFPDPDATVRARKHLGESELFGVRISISPVNCKSPPGPPENKSPPNKTEANTNTNKPKSETDADQQLTVDKRSRYKKRPGPCKSLRSKRPAAQKGKAVGKEEDDNDEMEDEECNEEEGAVGQENEDERMPLDPLTMRILEVLIAQPSLSLPMPQLMAAYAAYHGELLNPSRYNCRNIRHLVDCVSSIVQLQNMGGNGPPLLTLSEGRQRSIRTQQIFYVFLRRPDMEFSVGHFRHEMELTFGCCIDLYTLLVTFPEIVELVKVSPYQTLVRLTQLQRFALRSRLVLLTHGGQDVPMLVFQRSYETRFNEPFKAESFGYQSLLALVRAASHVLFFKGRGATATLSINENFLAALKALKSDIGTPGGLGDECPSLPARPPTASSGRRSFVRPPPPPPLERHKMADWVKPSPTSSSVADDRKQQQSGRQPLSPAKDSGFGSPGNSGDDDCFLSERFMGIGPGLHMPPSLTSTRPLTPPLAFDDDILIGSLALDDILLDPLMPLLMTSVDKTETKMSDSHKGTTSVVRKRKSRLALKFPSAVL